MRQTDIIRNYFAENKGILRMVPNFVPRRFGTAGRRLRLHPDDYFALGMERGSIKERWFSSVIPAMNGEKAPEDEGMSYVAVTDCVEDKVLFKSFVDELKDELIGSELYETYGSWPMYSKFFDFQNPLFHHVHLTFEAAARVGRLGKPEAYYFSPQMNPSQGNFPHTYFGFDPDVTKEEVKERLLQFLACDNRITELSRAYRIQLGTGWYTPPGVIHAPGSYLTYEPQWNSDVNSVYENIVESEIYPYDMLVENCPADKQLDMDYVISLLDWDRNVDPHYRKHYFRPPVTATESAAHKENWVVYQTPYIGAKELTVHPGQTVTIQDAAAYGCIVVQGHGKIGPHDCEAATMLRFGQLSADEFFVSEDAARKGVEFVNESRTEPLVLLKHFGPNCGMPQNIPDLMD